MFSYLPSARTLHSRQVAFLESICEPTFLVSTLLGPSVFLARKIDPVLFFEEIDSTNSNPLIFTSRNSICSLFSLIFSQKSISISHLKSKILDKFPGDSKGWSKNFSNWISQHKLYFASK